jgi:hypothetical protein
MVKPQHKLSVLAFLLLATSAFAQQSEDDALVKSVFGRLLAAPAASRPEGRYTSWPPKLRSSRLSARAAEQMRLNAFAAAPDCHPVVRISQGLMAVVFGVKKEIPD